MIAFINLLFDNNNNFDWRSVMATLSFLGVMFTAWISHRNNKKSLEQQREFNTRSLEQQKELSIENFKGNVVSTSRIEWIQEVRKQSVEFITLCFSFIKHVKLLKINGQLAENDPRELIKRIREDPELTKLKSDIEKSGTLLSLFFGPDTSGDNQFIEYVIHLITLKFNEMGESYSIDHVIALEDTVKVLKDFLRIYFKAEWNRANGEIKDTEIQKFLEAQPLYNKIKGIYSDGIETFQEWVDNYYYQLQLRNYSYDDED